MATQTQQVRPPARGRASPDGRSVNVGATLFRYGLLAAFNAMALIITYSLFSDDNAGLAAVFLIVTVFANVVTLVPGLFPIRWMAPGLMLMMLFVIYPVIYTVITAFSNYGDGHLLTKGQSIELIERRQFVPEGAQTYSWEVYQNEAGEYALWLSGSTVAFAPVGAPIQNIASPPADLPDRYQGQWLRVAPDEREMLLADLENAEFGGDDATVRIADIDTEAVTLEADDGAALAAGDYAWEAYRTSGDDFALWLTASTTAFAQLDTPIEDITEAPDAPPETYQGYRLLETAERGRALSTLQDTVFGTDEDTAAVRNRREAARPLQQQFIYDSEQDAFLDQATGVLYVADNDEGYFIPAGATDDEALAPGYRVGVGLDNFRQLYEDRTLLEPLIDVFVWTVVFSFLSVVTTFFFGLLMAMVLDHPYVPFRKLWRTLIFIPYAIPGVISVLVWKGMLNQNLGLITTTYFDLFGYRIPWFTDPWWAKFAILMVNLWLGYPYMMLICSGALQAIPSEVYEAAAVDGAKPNQTFWGITLPLLLISVGPLLVASFTYNFNNYLLIELLTEGNPPIPGTSTPAGHSDILISYTYNLAFGSQQGADYGYASAITIVIFAVVGLITLFNYRYVAQWERVGENV